MMINRTAQAALVVLLLALGAGCTSLKNQVTAPRDNQKLANDVAEQIFADGLGHDVAVNVSAEAGIVVLRGQVPTEERALAMRTAASGVNGVSRVDNRLRVEEPAEDGGKSSRTLTEDVREALEANLPKRGPRLAVVTDDGTVYLSGIVPDRTTRRTAVIIAMNVDGVRQVEDNLINEKP